MKSVWTNFDHKVKKLNQNIRPTHVKTLILAVSGGCDSMMLMNTLVKIYRDYQFVIAHFHHGPSLIKNEYEFRNKAQNFVEKSVLELKKHHSQIKFETSQSQALLKSEADFRKARLKFFDSLKEKYPSSLVVTGHHSQDVLETVLIKMIRGVGPDKLFNFVAINEKIWRPFWGLSPKEVRQAALDQKVDWVEDPSNQSHLYLRNWIRNKWLKDLDHRRPGSVYRFSQSLQNLKLALENGPHFHLVYALNKGEKSSQSSLNRQWWMTLNEAQKKRALATYMFDKKIVEFTEGHLSEIIKRLDKNQKELTFTILGRKWVINATQIMLE